MTTAEMMCQELVELVTDYLEAKLSSRNRRRFEAHLRFCPHCTAYVEQFRETIRLTGRLREEDIDPAAREALLDAFRTWKSSEL